MILLECEYSRADFKRGCFEFSLHKHSDVQNLSQISRPVELAKPEGNSDENNLSCNVLTVLVLFTTGHYYWKKRYNISIFWTLNICFRHKNRCRL